MNVSNIFCDHAVRGHDASSYFAKCFLMELSNILQVTYFHGS